MENPPSNLRQAWTGQVTPEDYELHMAAIGQAQANARLIRDMVEQWAWPGAKLLIAGAGTGQMFEYQSASFLSPFDVTFSDINPRFLAKLEQRVKETAFSGWRTVVDDLENTALAGPYDLLVVVLVLEHIDWRKGIASIWRIRPRRCVLVIQRNPAGMHSAVTPSRVPPGTMKAVVAAGPSLVDAAELVEEMKGRGFDESQRTSREVADGKQMVAIVFESSPVTP